MCAEDASGRMRRAWDLKNYAKMDIKLFGIWSFDGVEVREESLAKYICLKPVYLPHTGGRNTKKQFEKSKISVVERLANKLMRSGNGSKKVQGKFIRDGGNTGNKQNVLNIIRRAFKIIEKREKKNPIQVLVDAISNAGPREESTVIIYGGIKYPQPVDVSPQRKIDFALKHLALGAFAASYMSKQSIENALADEIINASHNNNKSYAISRKEEVERIAHSAR